MSAFEATDFPAFQPAYFASIHTTINAAKWSTIDPAYDAA
jgi:hypothetical protein